MANKKIKILYTIPNFDTAGSGKVVYDLVKNIDRSDFEPHICCFHTAGVFFKEIEKLKVPIHVFSFTAPYRPFLSFPFRLLKIVQFFRKYQFDIIHSWHWSSDFSEPLAAKLAGIPYLYTKKAMGWGNKAWVLRSKLSSRIIYINKDMGTQFFSKMKNKAVQIPIGVDTEFFKPQLKIEMTSEEIYINDNDFVIISVANLVPVKGIEILLEAVNNLRIDSIKVLIIGESDNEYGKQMKAKYANNNICFAGKKLDIRPYLSLSDLFVIPTKDEGRKEGLPIAPIEAMSCGKIVVGSDISGIKDVLEGFPNLVFEAGNIAHLEKVISRVMNFSERERVDLQFKMRKTVNENYSKDLFISRSETLYKEILE